MVGVAGQQPTLQVGVSSSTQTLTIPEGRANSYTLVLGSRPTGDVTVGVTLPTGTDLTLDKTSLTFTMDNWDVAQTVTVEGGHDVDGSADTATLTHSASGGDYASITVDLPVTVTDDDTAAIVLSETDLTVTEGYSAGSSYTVKLATQPSGEVTVTVSGQAGTDLTLDKTTLTFTVDNWDVAQTATVEGGHDVDAANDTATLTHSASGGDYAGITVDLPVTVTNDDTPALVLSETNLTVTEFSLDCAGTAAVWCADVEFSDQTAENWGWTYLRYGLGLDPEASLSDDDFQFRGVDYTVWSMELRPGTHPVMPNAWSRWQ